MAGSPIIHSILSALHITTSTAAGTDLNNYPNLTVVWVNNTSGSYTHAPGSTAYHIITIKPLSTHGFQLAIQYNSNNVFVRTVSDNNWGNWHTISVQ